MVNNLFKITRYIFLILLFCMPLSAQSRFVQRVEWESEPNAMEYKVEIEHLELHLPDEGDGGLTSEEEASGADEESSSEETPDTDNAAPGEKTPVTTTESSSIQKIHFFNTTETFIEFSYEPGRYRYRVYAYDFLGRETSVSNWQNFEIIRALEPKVTVRDKVEVEKGSKENLVIPVDVDFVTSESVIVLVDPATNEEIEGVIEDDPDYPGEKVVVFPPVKKPDYKIKITNPGGLTTETDLLDIAFIKKPYVMKHINIQTGGGVFFSFGQSFLSVYNQASINPVINFKISYLPFGNDVNRFGFEVGAQGTTVSYKNTLLEVNLPTEFLDLSFVYQRYLVDQMLALNAKIGAVLGFTQEVISINSVELETVCYTYPGGVAGVYLVWYPWKYFSLELGADCSILYFSGSITVVACPVINLGCRF